MSDKIAQENSKAEISNGVGEASSKVQDRPALKTFFQSMEERTSDPVHLRLLKAAVKRNRVSALERELTKIVEEILNEA